MSARILSLRAILTGLLLSLLVVMCGSLLATLVVIVANWQTNVRITFQIFSYISIAFGGLVAGRRANHYGWLHGGLVGLLYAGVIVVLFGDRSPDISLLLRLVTGFVCGAVGGVIGVNV